MKILKVLTLIFLCNLLFGTPRAFAQQSKLKIHGVSFGVGLMANSPKIYESDTNLPFDVSVIQGNNLFSLYHNKTEDLSNFYNILPTDDQAYYQELDLTFGKQWVLTDRWVLEGHAGLGYFQHKYYGLDEFNSNQLIKESTIGFPLRAKLIYYFRNHFGLGLNPNLNINSLNTVLSAAILFQFKFH